jgi:hypothetical protein
LVLSLDRGDKEEMEFNEFFVLMERGNILCIYSSLHGVLTWRPKFALKGPLEIHRVKRLDGEFKTQIITTSPEAFEPLTPFRQPYPPFVEE